MMTATQNNGTAKDSSGVDDIEHAFIEFII